MKRIYKYPLEMANHQEIEMPKGAKILSANNQREVVCLWAAVDPDEKVIVKRKIRIAGTGHAIVNFGSLKFIDTVICHKPIYSDIELDNNGSLIWHIFEEK